MSTTTIDLMDVDSFAAGRGPEIFRLLRAEDPLHWNPEPDGGPGFWSLTRYADVRSAAADYGLFSSALGTQIPDRKAEGADLESVHHTDPPRHKRLRRVVAPQLRKTRISARDGQVRQIVDDLLDEALAHGAVDFVDMVTARLPVLVLGGLFGVPASDAPLLLGWANTLTSGQPDGLDTAREQLRSYFAELSERRRAEPRGDLVTAMVQAEIDGQPLGREDLDPYYILLVGAGNETTRHLLSGAIATLAEHPWEWELLRSDPERLDEVIEELMRYVSPVMCMRRNATERIDWYGRTIDAGDKVVLWFASANWDDSVFTEPDRFVVGRRPNDHMGFGWGVHACMGLHLARLEVRVLLRRILERGLSVHLDDPPQRLRSNALCGIERLPVTLAG